MITMKPVWDTPLALAEGDAKLVKLLILPDGFTPVTQGTFQVDETAWSMVEMKFKRRKLKMLFDYEHQSLGGPYNSRPDGLSPAAGWIHKLEYVAGKGIFAHVEWTDQARDLIKAKQYLYFSPVINVDKSGRVTKLVSVAVTNTPALSGEKLEPLAAKERTGEQTMKWKLKKAQAGDLLGKARVVLQDVTPEEEQATVEEVVDAVDEIGALIAELKTALGLGEDVVAEDVLKAAIAKVGAGEGDEGGETEESLKALKAALNVDAAADLKVMTAKANELQSKTVDPTAQAKMVETLKVLTAEKADREATVLVEKYVGTKLNPNHDDRMKWARGFALSDPARFEETMALMPDATPPEGQITDPDATKNGRTGIIASATTEFKAAPGELGGVELWAFVNESLKEKDHPILTDGERKALVI